MTPASVGDSIRHYFAYRASINRLELRQLLQQGRTSLAIGVCFLAACRILGQIISQHTRPGAFWDVARESLTICGWVASIGAALEW
jgi:hypothetical protein